MEQLIVQARKDMEAFEQEAKKIYENRAVKVLDAFREERVTPSHFSSTNGYGYNDSGREKIEMLWARVFCAEAALLRQQIVSGSHAIALALFGNLLPGDELVSVGMPYDTLQTVMGLKKNTPCSLAEMGVNCKIVDFDFVQPNIDAVLDAITPQTKMVAMQRSRGYALRPSMPVALIAEITRRVKERYPHVIVFVDNCYGEFVELQEPTEVGVDLMAGSLIKNPGAGLAPGGGYVVGKETYVERAACRLTIPGAGREIGASISDNRLYFQALFQAPQIVHEALLGAVFTASLVKQLGFTVDPEPDAARTDIIQTIQLGDAERLKAYCRGIQKYSPVDSFVTPEPWPMPGYDDEIIMAAGGFVSGSSIELSADAPLREPYLVFQQGGLSRYHVVYAVTNTLKDMRAEGLL